LKRYSTASGSLHWHWQADERRRYTAQPAVQSWQVAGPGTPTRYPGVTPAQLKYISCFQEDSLHKQLFSIGCAPCRWLGQDVAAATMAGTHVQLRRDLASPNFVSWRLAGGSLPTRHAVDLPGDVCRHEPQTYDFLSARIAALRSHLYVHGHQLWAFVQGTQGLQLCGFAARGDAYAVTHTVGAHSPEAIL